MIRKRAWAICTLLAIAGGAFAQQPHPQATSVAAAPVSVETVGEGTVESEPDYVEFWLHGMRTGLSVAEAIKGTAPFEAAIRTEMEERGLAPSELTVFDPVVIDASLVVIGQDARLRFSAKDFTGVADGLEKFGNLCDQMRAVCTKLLCAMDGPSLGLDDPKILVQAAVSKAVEKAYPTAESAAAIMSAVVSQVSKVALVDVAWNAPPDMREKLPSLKRVVCTATVRVTYYVGAVAQ